MNAPRWFYVVIALCSVALTLSVGTAALLRAGNGRWVAAAIGPDSPLKQAAIDTKTGDICGWPGGGRFACIDRAEARIVVRAAPTVRDTPK
jgi:hypothetical protein